MKNFWAILVAMLVLIGAQQYDRWHHGEQKFKAGKGEVQALWNADKAALKAKADKQAEETLNTNKGNEDALKKTQADLRDSRRNLSITLERLRDLPAVSGQGYLQVAGGERAGAAVSGLASDSSGIGIRVEERIGSCVSSSSEPCFVSRGFFEQAVSDADDRRLTREWSVGYGIKAVKGAQK